MKRTFSWACLSALTISTIARAVLGQTTVGPGEVHPVTVSTAESFELDGGTLAPTNVTLSGTINLESSSSIIRPQNPIVPDSRGNPREVSKGPTNLNGLVSGTGDLRLGNQSRDQLFVNGSNTYTGHTYITAGDIFATASTAFGSNLGATTVQGGNVYVHAATDERFRIEGGTLRFNAGDFVPSTPITIAGGEVYLPNRDLYQVPIVVDGAGGAIRFSNNVSASWTGGSTGTGSLRLAGRISVDAPLTHDGDLIIAGVRLNVPNTYTGKTVIVGDYVIDRPEVFGTATSPIEIDEGNVTLRVLPNGNRGFAVKWGTLNVETLEPVSAGIILGGRFSAALIGAGTFNGPIDYVTGPGGGDAHIAGGTFNGPIRGDTLLRLGGDPGITLNAANAIQGLVHVTSGKVVVNHADALTLPATLIQGGLVEMNTPANGLPMLTRYPYGDRQTGKLRLNVDQHFSDLSYLQEGTLESTADVRFDRLLVYGAELTSAEDAIVTIGDELLALGTGSVSGTIKGNGAIRLVGSELRVSGDLSQFEGDLVVENGTFAISGQPRPLGSGDIFVRGTGRLDFGGYFSEARTVTNTIFLHNDDLPLPGFPTGLTYSQYGGGPLTIAGRLDVGEHGGSIADSDGIYITGQITGHSLRLRGSGIVIASPQHQLDVLKVADGGISIDPQGGLYGLEAIHLETGTINLSPALATDRVGDSVGIHSNNGGISLTSDRSTPTSEVIGTLHVDRGFTGVFNSSDHGSLDATLTFNRVERQPGALLHFREAGRVTNTRIQSVDTFDGKMIGAWATTDDGFASLDASGIVGTLQATEFDINAARPTDHVRTHGTQTLTADRIVASVHGQSGFALDLGGHRLTVRSGGLLNGGEIVNGTLTAGDGQPTELILSRVGFNTRRIEADIVDNGSAGAVTLVVGPAADYPVILSGNNTYSGGTRVVGNLSPSYDNPTQLTIEDLQAIPNGDRVYLDFGQYDVRLEEPGVVELAELHVRNAGSVTGVNATIDAEVYYFEHGSLNTPLAGNGTIYKDSSQRFEFGNDSDSPGFTGSLYLRDGYLRLDSESIPNASLFVEGGWLEAGGEFSRMSNEIVLDGGQLQGNFGGAIHVISGSSLYHNGYTLLYGPLSGDGDLTVRGTRSDNYVGIFGDASQYTGDLHVQTGALRIGAPANFGAGEIHVGEGAQLILGSDRPEYGQTFLNRDVHIRRGTLYVTPPSDIFEPDTPNGVITGNVYVHDVAFFGANDHAKLNNQRLPGLVFAGGVVLDDGASVFGRTRYNAVYFVSHIPLVEISGHLDVGRDNVWHLELATLGVTGTIRSRVPDASIDFQGVASLLQIDQATIAAEAGHTLRITVNGELRDLHLAGAGAGLAGNGSLSGNFLLSDGATVAPGSTPGTLTIAGDLELGPEAVYEWEIENQAAGAGVGWDMLHVDGTLAFNATPDSPWILQINELGDALAFENSEWLIASATTIDGFDATSVQVVTGNISDRFQRSMADRFSIETRGTGVYLMLTVPEPTTTTCIALLCLTLLASRGARDV